MNSDKSAIRARTCLRLSRICIGGPILILVMDASAMKQLENVHEVEPCQWSPVVRVGSTCTGAYVGNRMIVSAAHCRKDISTVEEDPDHPSAIRFGESTYSADDEDETVSFSTHAERCRKYPGGSITPQGTYSGVDLMWCYLEEEPPFNIASIPIMVPDRCERDWLARQIKSAAPTPPAFTIVGMGCHIGGCSTSDSGRKRFAGMKGIGHTFDDVRTFPLQWIDWEDDGNLDMPVTDGDSGGPTYVRLPDGTWRLIGVSSESGSDVTVQSVPPFLAWIEKSSGVDVTPCHELNESSGEWGRYDFADDDNCDMAYSSDPLQVGEWDDADGCGGPRTGPDVTLADECAHWGSRATHFRAPLP